MKLAGANSKAKISGIEELPFRSNYYSGNDPAKWRTNVPSYAKVRYEDVYPGVDLVYYGNQRQLEYDFVVAPGADPSRISLEFAGADRIEVDDRGDLVLRLGEEQVRFQKPTIYQETHGSRREVAGGYALSDSRHVSFHVASYERDQPLIIDPVLLYSTYIGGSGVDNGIDIAVDSAGSVYAAGYTSSLDFPTLSAFDASLGGDSDAFVVKLNLTASGAASLVYSSYLGGSLGDGGSVGVAVDSLGNTYITGSTISPDFPTLNAFDSSYNGDDDIFVAKLSPSGGLLYSTFLGGSGSDFPNDGTIALDPGGNAYITGGTTSPDFPTLNAFDPSHNGESDLFVVKLNPAASGAASLLYSSFVGGSGYDEGLGIAVDCRQRLRGGQYSFFGLPRVKRLSHRLGWFQGWLSHETESWTFWSCLGALFFVLRREW